MNRKSGQRLTFPGLYDGRDWIQHTEIGSRIREGGRRGGNQTFTELACRDTIGDHDTGLVLLPTSTDGDQFSQQDDEPADELRQRRVAVP